MVPGHNRYKLKFWRICFYGIVVLFLTAIYLVALNQYIYSIVVDKPYILYNDESSKNNSLSHLVSTENIKFDRRDILCPLYAANSTHKLKLNETISLVDAEKALKDKVLPGGSFTPHNCMARWKIAIFVCFRDRDEHLGPFHYHLHNFLQHQQIQYTIYLVNQTDDLPFNRAKLFNVGYMESLSDGPYDCFVFHDVDFLPDDARNLYYCSDMPRHMTVYYDNHPYINDKVFQKYFGGVVMLKEEHLKMVNGWSNSFWGWGGEDDDMKLRILKQNLTIWRYPKDIGHYKMLKHKSSPKNPKRYQKLKKSKEMMAKDGLNSLNYKLDSIIQHPLFTSINVNLTDKDSPVQ